MRLARPLVLLLASLALVAFGFWLGRSDLGRAATEVVHHAAVEAVAEQADLDTRMRVLLEHPEIIQAVQRGGGFGGDFSPLIGQNMFSRDPEVIAEAVVNAVTAPPGATVATVELQPSAPVGTGEAD